MSTRSFVIEPIANRVSGPIVAPSSALAGSRGPNPAESTTSPSSTRPTAPRNPHGTSDSSHSSVAWFETADPADVDPSPPCSPSVVPEAAPRPPPSPEQAAAIRRATATAATTRRVEWMRRVLRIAPR